MAVAWSGWYSPLRYAASTAFQMSVPDPLTVSVALDQSHYKGSATVRQTEFGITPISIVGGTVKVKDEVKIDFDIALE